MRTRDTAPQQILEIVRSSELRKQMFLQLFLWVLCERCRTSWPRQSHSWMHQDFPIECYRQDSDTFIEIIKKLNRILYEAGSKNVSGKLLGKLETNSLRKTVILTRTSRWLTSWLRLIGKATRIAVHCAQLAIVHASRKFVPLAFDSHAQALTSRSKWEC